MSYILSINSKEQKYFKSCNFKDFTKDDGLITHRMESGISDTLFRWAYANYTLVMQFLTQEQVTEIFSEVTRSIFDFSSITLDFVKLTKAGKLDLVGNPGVDPDFYTDPTTIKISRVPGTNLWNITMKLEERIDREEVS